MKSIQRLQLAPWSLEEQRLLKLAIESGVNRVRARFRRETLGSDAVAGLSLGVESVPDGRAHSDAREWIAAQHAEDG